MPDRIPPAPAAGRSAQSHGDHRPPGTVALAAEDAWFEPGADIRRSRARACLLGGAIGDALGAPVEFLKLQQIRKQYDARGVAGFVAGYWPAGTITDDTQMTLFTAEGLIRARVRLSEGGSCELAAVVNHAYVRWLVTQDRQPAVVLDRAMDGLLLGMPALHALRAPGNTCLTALEAVTALDGRAAANDSKGCGGVMRVAPVGLFAGCRGASFEWGRKLAALTHGHPTGSLAAGAFAQLVEALYCGQSLAQALVAVTDELSYHPQHEETLAAIEGAVSLAKEAEPSAERVEQLGGGWVAEEALAIAVYCALTARTFAEGVLLAVNHGGDSDSTGSIAGNLLGLIHGEESLPGPWLRGLELRDLIARVAEDLVDSAELGSRAAQTGNARARWAAYPGH